MVKMKRTIQWSKWKEQYNGQNEKNNTMVKMKRTIQWSKWKEQYNGQNEKNKKTNNDLHRKLKIEQF